jgi:hypothetical protein
MRFYAFLANQLHISQPFYLLLLISQNTILIATTARTTLTASGAYDFAVSIIPDPILLISPPIPPNPPGEGVASAPPPRGAADALGIGVKPLAPAGVVGCADGALLTEVRIN